MLINSVRDESFREYGKILEGFDNRDLVKRMGMM